MQVQIQFKLGKSWWQDSFDFHLLGKNGIIKYIVYNKVMKLLSSYRQSFQTANIMIVVISVMVIMIVVLIHLRKLQQRVKQIKKSKSLISWWCFHFSSYIFIRLILFEMTSLTKPNMHLNKTYDIPSSCQLLIQFFSIVWTSCV